MRRLTGIIVLAVLSAVPASAQIANANVAPPTQSSNGNSAVEDIPNRSVIRGRVAHADTNKPIRRTEIALLSTELNSEMDKVTTDDEGRFVFKGVRRGKYYFKINSPGVLNPDRNVAARIDDSNEIDYAKLDAEFDHLEVDGVSESQAFVRARRAGVISGRITYEDGEPAPGVTVIVMRKTDEYLQYDRSDGLNVETDDRGYYRIWGLADGEYAVMVNERSRRSGGYRGESNVFAELKTFYPGTADVDEAKLIKVEQGVEQSEINITISGRKVFSVSGKVLDKATGKPMPFASVSVKTLDDSVLRIIDFRGRIENASVTDESGEFVIEDLPAGNYQVIVSAQNWFDSDSDGKPNTIRSYGRVRKEFTLDDKDLVLNVEIPPQSVVSGKIRLESGTPPPSYAFVYLLEDGRIKDESAEAYISGQSFESGIAGFQLNNLYAGEFDVMSVASDGYFVKSARAGSVDLLAAALKLKEGETMDNVEIVISNAVGTIAGKVTDYDASRLTAKVLLIPIADRQNLVFLRSQSISVKGDGSFQGTAAPGDYFVKVYDAADLRAADLRQKDDEPWQEYFSRVTKGGTRVTISVGKTTNIELAAPRR